MVKYKFRLLKNSNWGIAIDIYGYVETISSNKDKILEDTTAISENIFFRTSNIPLIKIKENESFALDGLFWVKSSIEKSIKSEEVTLITIKDILINPTDFQEEGLFFAFAEWASKAFSFPIPKYEFSFDKTQNRYVFPDVSKLNKSER